MSLTVTYDLSLASTSIDTYLSDWATGFFTAGHGYSNTGGFNTGTFSGSQYATHGANGSDYAFIAGSDTANGLNYVFNPALPASSNLNHYLWGSLDEVSLGYQLDGGSGSNYTLDSEVVTFSGLDLEAALGAGRTGNEVHQVIYGLMQGDTSALAAVINQLLEGYEVTTADSFAAVAAALANGPVNAVSAEAVGVQSQVDDLALAA
ncbi:heme acquisition protein HasA [Pseudomonas sp. 148P]|uniref:Heme acquisition protein HasA n=1 Tax=Pseudomonas ulcerans TaxID=3115852 RepID=A0ABU7HNE3_9PSED|nr:MULTISPECIES: heme acquisition protein HasA [unclassified Pseudomonas]MEE1922573.1 heme acquisition protein HasA [Pseudomonas sp. 147P]MEE1933047.1 heme acquisition protein HasA [Pseudomonas sp. 148P]